MSTVTEIEAAIERLSPHQLRELADWLADRMITGETPAMLAALDVGIRSLETEPTVPAEDVRKKIALASFLFSSAALLLPRKQPT
jgi:hypothetical protein